MYVVQYLDLIAKFKRQFIKEIYKILSELHQ